VTHGVKKVLFISSAHVYGISPRMLPTPEDSPPLLQWDIYTSSKISGERILEQCYSTYNLPYTTIRLFNSYGPGQTPDYFIPKKIMEAKKGDIVLKGANTTKDFVYLDDTISALTLALQTDYVGSLNVGSGNQYTLKDVAETIATEYGHKVIIDPDQPPVTQMQASIGRIRNVLGWYPKVSFEEGLKRTLKSYS
jgi:nucleoside-diphosphate-sugar epimerase